MTIEEAIRAHLVSQVTGAGGRVDPFQPKPAAVFPLEVYKRVYTEETYSHSGFSGLVYCRFQIESWGDTYAAVKALAAQVRAAFRGFRGLMGGAGGVQVGATMISDETDAYQPDLKKHVTITDVKVWFNE